MIAYNSTMKRQITLGTYTNGQQTLKKMLNNISSQGNTNQNYNEMQHYITLTWMEDSKDWLQVLTKMKRKWNHHTYGNVKWYSHFKKVWKYYPREKKTKHAFLCTKTCMKMFIPALFKIAKKWKVQMYKQWIYKKMDK